MFSDTISDYFEGVAAKYLSAVDASKKKGVHKQHEIGGLPEVGFRQLLGSPGKDEKLVYPARLVYLSDTEDAPVFCEDMLTWYDARWKHPTRSAEYRLYYKSNAVTSLFSEGDFFLIGKRTDGSLLLVFCPPDTTIEAQLRAIFGLDAIGSSFSKGDVSASSLILPIRLLLEDLGLVTVEHDGQSKWLDMLLRKFGGEVFPATAEFSALARETLKGELDPVASPDAALMAWMEHEEFLFRIYERHIVQQRLCKGFGVGGDDVDEFISYSLSVQNRRKSRVGHAFEGHLEALFMANKLQYERPRGKGKITENNTKPDFMFPSFAHYHNDSFPAEKLIVLGAKTTCKDRWRQVLSEANRVERKHLITLEPAISVAQTSEMASSKLQLVVPQGIQLTYTDHQREALKCVKEFVECVRKQTT